MIKKAVSEYYLFAVEGKETIENGWGKELPNPIVENIPFDLSYEINPQKYGNQVVKFYKLKNSEDHELGKEPLPDGRYYVYSDDGRDGLRFEGSTSHKYIPRGEDIELNLGTDGLVLYEARTMEYSRTNFDFTNDGNIAGWDEVRTIQLEIKNSRNREIPVKLWHYIEGDWEFDNVSDQDYEQVDQRTVKWEFDVDPQSTKIIEYTSTTRLGSRAKR